MSRQRKGSSLVVLCLEDDGYTADQIDIGPAQSQELTLSGSRRHSQHHEGIEASILTASARMEKACPLVLVQEADSTSRLPGGEP